MIYMTSELTSYQKAIKTAKETYEQTVLELYNNLQKKNNQFIERISNSMQREVDRLEMALHSRDIHSHRGDASLPNVSQRFNDKIKLRKHGVSDTHSFRDRLHTITMKHQSYFLPQLKSAI